jgi:hypothetical protein
LLPKGKQGNTGDLDDLESDTGNITLSLTLSTETGKEDLVVLVNKVQTTVIGDEGSDLLTVLDELNSDTLSNGRVGLLGLNTNLFKDNSLSVGRATERRGLEGSSEKSLLVSKIRPTAIKEFVSKKNLLDKNCNVTMKIATRY